MKTLVRLFTLAMLVSALPMLAQDWSAVGSVAHVDEASLGIYAVNGPNLEFLPGASGTMFARYHVTNTYGAGITNFPPWGRLVLGYLDNGNQVTIHARLMRLELCTGTVTQLCEIKGTDSTASHCDVCPITQVMNFQNYAYYVEVDLSRTSTSGVAIVHHVGLQ
jgi:hypothetical protein